MFILRIDKECKLYYPDFVFIIFKTILLVIKNLLKLGSKKSKYDFVMFIVLNGVWKHSKSGCRIFRRFSSVDFLLFLSSVEIVCENLELLH